MKQHTYLTRADYNAELEAPKTVLSDKISLNRVEIQRGMDYVQEEHMATGASRRRPAPERYNIYSSDAEEKLIDQARSIPRVGIVHKDPALNDSKLTIDPTVKNHLFSLPDPTTSPAVRTRTELKEKRAAQYQIEADNTVAETAKYYKPRHKKLSEFQEAMNAKTADLVGQNAPRQLMTQKALMLSRRQELIKETIQAFDDKFRVKKDLDRPPWELDEISNIPFISPQDATWKPYHDRGGLYNEVLRNSKTRLLHENYKAALSRAPPCQASSEGDVLVPVPFQLADQPPGTIETLTQKKKRAQSDSKLVLSISREPFPEGSLPEVYRPIQSVFSKMRSKELNQKSFLESVHITETPEDYAPMYSSFTKDGYYREPMLPQIPSTTKPPASNLISQRRGRHIYILPDAVDQISVTSENLVMGRLLTTPPVLFD